MDKKIILKLIMIVLGATIVLTLALLLLQGKKQEGGKGNIEQGEFVNAENFADTYGKTEENKIDRQAYTDVVTCVTEYFKAINIKNDAYYTYDEKGNYVLAVDEIRLKENIYHLLSQNYISQNQVTVQNVYEKVETLETPVLFVPTEIAMIQDSAIKSFAISGLLELQQNYQVTKRVVMVVHIDMRNSTYSIEPIKEENVKLEEIKVSQTQTEIQVNEHNRYTSVTANHENTVKDYINLYKRLALGSPEKIYDLIDKDYKAAKFGNLENFKKYIEKNKTETIGINPQQYQVTQQGKETQYTIIDQNGAYYIIREKGVLDYTILLDTYTIDLPEFTEKYQKSTEEQKVLLNIQKFFEAINHQDYQYAYSKLDETFKAQNFKTIAEFETYIKKNFFNKSKLAAGKVQKQGDIYLYEINTSDATSNDTSTKKKNFVMQLKEGTDFVMSFGT